jgi:hypothetical protein
LDILEELRKDLGITNDLSFRSKSPSLALTNKELVSALKLRTEE